MISPYQFFVPDLYRRLFDPEYVPPPGEGEEGGVFNPTSEEDFDAMVAEWESDGWPPPE